MCLICAIAQTLLFMLVFLSHGDILYALAFLFPAILVLVAFTGIVVPGFGSVYVFVLMANGFGIRIVTADFLWRKVFQPSGKMVNWCEIEEGDDRSGRLSVTSFFTFLSELRLVSYNFLMPADESEATNTTFSLDARK